MNKDNLVYILQTCTKSDIDKCKRNVMVCFSEKEALDWVYAGEEKYIQRCLETLPIYTRNSQSKSKGDEND